MEDRNITLILGQITALKYVLITPRNVDRNFCQY